MSGFDDYLKGDASQGSSGGFDAYLSGGSAPAASSAPLPTPSNSPSMLSSLGAGLGKGFGQSMLGLQQLAGHGITSLADLAGAPADSMARRAGTWLTNDANTGMSKLDAQNAPYAAANPTTNMVGNVGGQIAAAVPLTVGSGGVGGAAASGALAAAEQGVDPNDQNFWSTKAGQAAVGGGLGAAGGALTNAILPRISPAVRSLMDDGVRVTPGMAAGGSVNDLEQKMTSLPFAGPSIAAARQRAVADWNLARYSDALEPIGGTLPAGTQAGGAGVQAVRNQVGQAFDNVANSATFDYDHAFHADLASIRNNLDQMVPQSTMDEFDRVVNGQIMNKMDPNSGMMSGQMWNTSRSNIGTRVRNIRIGQPNADQTELANALDQVNDAMTQNVIRSSPANVGPDLQNANLAYARYKQIERAAGYRGAGNQGNVFTPAQFNAAVAAGSTAAQKATGSGLSADVGQIGQQVMGGTVPDSGTAGRGMVEGLIATPHLIAHPGLALTTALSPLAYSRAGNAAYRAALPVIGPAARAGVGPLIGIGAGQGVGQLGQ